MTWAKTLLRPLSCPDLPASDKPGSGISIQSKGLLAAISVGTKNTVSVARGTLPLFQTSNLPPYSTITPPTWTHQPTYPPTIPLTCWPTYSPTELPSYLPAYLPTCLPTYLLPHTHTNKLPMQLQDHVKTSTHSKMHMSMHAFQDVMSTHPTAPRKTCNVPHISDCGHFKNTDCFAMRAHGHHQTTRQQSCTRRLKNVRGAPGRTWPPKGCKRTES